MAPNVTYRCLEERTAFHMIYSLCYLRVIWGKYCWVFCPTELVTISLDVFSMAALDSQRFKRLPGSCIPRSLLTFRDTEHFFHGEGLALRPTPRNWSPSHPSVKWGRAMLWWWNVFSMPRTFSTSAALRSVGRFRRLTPDISLRAGARFHLSVWSRLVAILFNDELLLLQG
jgi:hypothetical protein